MCFLSVQTYSKRPQKQGIPLYIVSHNIAITFYLFLRQVQLNSNCTCIMFPTGFITMTPQLFINYKMKSVAHLPWRMLTYKALNTFIDDLFAFVIKMPMMYRIGCLRDGTCLNFTKWFSVMLNSILLLLVFFII